MNILSISDVITNSSSEVFCTITSENQSVLEEIYDILYEVIESAGNPEEYPVLSSYGEILCIEMPYSYSDAIKFYKAGIEAILFKNNIKDYTINYE